MDSVSREVQDAEKPSVIKKFLYFAVGAGVLYWLAKAILFFGNEELYTNGSVNQNFMMAYFIGFLLFGFWLRFKVPGFLMSAAQWFMYLMLAAIIYNFMQVLFDLIISLSSPDFVTIVVVPETPTSKMFAAKFAMGSDLEFRWLSLFTDDFQPSSAFFGRLYLAKLLISAFMNGISAFMLKAPKPTPTQQ